MINSSLMITTSHQQGMQETMRIELEEDNAEEEAAREVGKSQKLMAMTISGVVAAEEAVVVVEKAATLMAWI
jgi:hypothetical protein